MRVPQKAGTLERVINHDKEAFKTAWDFLAESSVDEEDD